MLTEEKLEIREESLLIDFSSGAKMERALCTLMGPLAPKRVLWIKTNYSYILNEFFFFLEIFVVFLDYELCLKESRSHKTKT